jgi:hypothetical protein
MELNEILTNAAATITALTALLTAIEKLVKKFFGDDDTDGDTRKG